MPTPVYFFIALILFFYLWGKYDDYKDEKDAEKELPLLLDEVKKLEAKQKEYLKYEFLIKDSVVKYRENYEENKSKQAYFAKKRYRKRY